MERGRDEVSHDIVEANTPGEPLRHIVALGQVLHVSFIFYAYIRLVSLRRDTAGSKCVCLACWQA